MHSSVTRALYTFVQTPSSLWEGGWVRDYTYICTHQSGGEYILIYYDILAIIILWYTHHYAHTIERIENTGGIDIVLLFPFFLREILKTGMSLTLRTYNRNWGSMGEDAAHMRSHADAGSFLTLYTGRYLYAILDSLQNCTSSHWVIIHVDNIQRFASRLTDWSRVGSYSWHAYIHYWP